MVVAFVKACGRAIRFSITPFISAFRDVGIEVVDPVEGGRAHRYGVLLFEEPDEEVYSFLRETSRIGETRIVAVGIARPLRAKQAWCLLEAGASDVIIGPNQIGAYRVKARLERWAKVDALMDSDWVRERMVGASRSWREKLRELVEAAYFTTSPVLLMGESGTGKNLPPN